MKNVLAVLLLAALTVTGVSAKPRAKKEKMAPKQAIEQQLSSYIAYPEVLQQANREGVVVIRFKVNEDSRLGQLEVLSQDDKLNNSLIQQLTGKKVDLAKVNPEQTHTVRLRFQLE